MQRLAEAFNGWVVLELCRQPWSSSTNKGRACVREESARTGWWQEKQTSRWEKDTLSGWIFCRAMKGRAWDRLRLYHEERSWVKMHEVK